MAESGDVNLPDDRATQELGARLARCLKGHRQPAGLTIYLWGDLGAGKTTLTRGFLRELGHSGRVPSPTYTLIEPYDLGGQRVYHIDLYRIRHPAELDELGLGELLSGAAVALIEWPDHGAGHLPDADIAVHLRMGGDGRLAHVSGLTGPGRLALKGVVTDPLVQ